MCKQIFLLVKQINNFWVLMTNQKHAHCPTLKLELVSQRLRALIKEEIRFQDCVKERKTSNAVKLKKFKKVGQSNMHNGGLKQKYHTLKHRLGWAIVKTVRAM